MIQNRTHRRRCSHRRTSTITSIFIPFPLDDSTPTLTSTLCSPTTRLLSRPNRANHFSVACYRPHHSICTSIDVDTSVSISSSAPADDGPCTRTYT